jgi:hypothetical protein
LVFSVRLDNFTKHRIRFTQWIGGRGQRIGVAVQAVKGNGRCSCRVEEKGPRLRTLWFLGW